MTERKKHMVFCGDGGYFFEEEPLHPSAAMRLTYYSHHLPTGHVNQQTALFLDRNSYERTLKRWNQQGTGTWEYTKTDPRLGWVYQAQDERCSECLHGMGYGSDLKFPFTCPIWGAPCIGWRKEGAGDDTPTPGEDATADSGGS